jgi:putative FmdB family regulatory protein
MPTYQYHCTKCDQEFDVFQSMTENPLTTCPKDLCRMGKWGKGKVKKLISAGAGLIFKGSGFYITDYRSESYKEAAKKDSSSNAPAASDAKASSGSDSKPAAAKAEAKPAKTEAKPKSDK